MDDCATMLSEKAKAWLKALGSKEISNVGYRQGFAFIGRSGDNALEYEGATGQYAANEKRASSSKDQVQVTQLFS